MNTARQPLAKPTQLLLVADAWCNAKSVCDAVAQEIEHPANVFVVSPALEHSGTTTQQTTTSTYTNTTIPGY
jgi:hypothetical protein